MRILFLTPDLPLPADQGAKLRNAALIRVAAQHHQVDLVSFSPEGLTPDQVDPDLQKLCDTIRVAQVPEPRTMATRAWNLIMGTAPDVALRLESMEYVAALQDACEARRYDLVQIEGLEMTPYLNAAKALAPRAAVIYDAHNAEMSLQRSMFQVEFRHPLRWHAGLYSMLQWSKLGTYERLTMNDTDMVLCVSKEDGAKLKGRHVDPQLVPNGVDTRAVAYRAPSADPGRNILFVGPLGYRPNADAIAWFLRHVFPLVRRVYPNANLRVAGKGSERLTGEGVEGLGYVEDFQAELGRADVAIAPLRMGSGSRFKILDAMAAGVPVVSTSVGVAGIEGEHDRDLLVADDPRAFAAHVVQLLSDRELAARLSKSARTLVESRYDWSKITPNYLRLLNVARQTARGRR